MGKLRSLLSLVGFAGSAALALRRISAANRRRPDYAVRLGPSARSSSPARAAGAGADSPADIPLRGWREVAKRTAAKFSENELMSEAASVTFFALLALFPAVTAIVSIYGLFADPSAIQQNLDTLSALLPSGGMEIIGDQVKRLTASPASGLGLGAVLGILVALWSANQGTKAMFSALNAVYGEHEDRGFVRLTATTLVFTVCGVAFLLLGIGTLALVPLIFRFAGLDSVFEIVARIVRWPVILIALVGALSVLYRFGPSRRPARWRWVTWGGTIAAVAWVLLSVGFSWYVTNFGHYNQTYGSLGAAIGFMTWIWLSSTVVLVGGQINAELEMQTSRDSTTGYAKPRGTIGASAADAFASR